MSRRFRLSSWATAGASRSRSWTSGWKRSRPRWSRGRNANRRRQVRPRGKFKQKTSRAPVPAPTKGGHMFGLGSKTIVGLDVGSSSIKAVELKKKGGQIEVAHLGLEPLSSDIVVDSMIVDSGTVSSAIS